MSDDLARAFYEGVKAGEAYADEHRRWMSTGTLYTRDQTTRPKRPKSPYPTEEDEFALTCYAMAHFGEGGPRYYVKGHRVSREEYERFTWWPGNPVFDQLLEDWQLCRNCMCRDCGCCVGCGMTDADEDPSHPGGGYCVL